MIERLLRDRTAVSRSDGSFHTLFPTAITAEESLALRDRVRAERATNTIEIGLGYGVSTLSICEALCLNDAGSARHVAIDPHQRAGFADCGLQFLEDAGVAPMVEHVAEESLLALPKLLARRHTFDFAFVDGNHRFDAVFVDLVYLGRLLRPGAAVFLDDHQLPGVAKAAAFFVANRDWTVEEVSAAHDEHRWAVLRTSREPDRRPFHHFVDF